MFLPILKKLCDFSIYSVKIVKKIYFHGWKLLFS